MNSYRFCAPCHFGLEKTLMFELKKLGAEEISVSDGQVRFSGGDEICAKANIFTAAAERIYIILGEFRAETYDDIFAGIEKAELARFISKNDAFPNNGHALNSKLSSIPAIQKRVKLAMARNLGKAYGLERMPEDGKEKKIRFSIMKDVFSLFLDTSGESLHKRGYRRLIAAPEKVEAPIRETLAAGIADLARVRENDFVCDPFCGSGTLLIESALKALNIAPGLNRKFAAEGFSFIDKKAWENARNEARALEKKNAGFRAAGFDIDKGRVEFAKAAIKKAGAEKYISVEQRDIRDFSGGNYTKIITNPPYGERLLDMERARELYGIMGKKLGGEQVFVITSDERFEEFFGKKADKNRKLYNGMMKARLYSFFGEAGDRN